MHKSMLRKIDSDAQQYRYHKVIRSVWALSLGYLLLTTSAWSEVLVSWRQSELPAKPLGVSGLVIPFAPDNATKIQNATTQGYRVYIEVSLAQFADAEKLAGKNSIAGLIIDTKDEQDTENKLQKLRADYPKVTIRMLSANGKQPQMRGQTVTTSNGVLQVSSATAQPWLDSNLAMIRYEQALRPNVKPIYSFAWELTDTLQQENGPSADDYMLAIAESGLLHADLILNLHPTLEKGLLADEAAARTTWNKMLSCIKFASAQSDPTLLPWSNIAVIADNYDAAYEPMNLMARHNIPFRVFPGATARDLETQDVAVALTTPSAQESDILNRFAQRGGTVIVVDARGRYPWQSGQKVQTAEHTVSYAAEKGRVFELSEPISDPETFAEDVRRLTPKTDVLISLWNALTTIAVPYRDDRSGDVVVEVLNFAQEPMRVQVQLKGSYSSIRYETPDQGCCQELTPVKHDGFTDFVVPTLAITGRVHLKPGSLDAGSKHK